MLLIETSEQMNHINNLNRKKYTSNLTLSNTDYKRNTEENLKMFSSEIIFIQEVLRCSSVKCKGFFFFLAFDFYSLEHNSLIYRCLTAYLRHFSL